MKAGSKELIAEAKIFFEIFNHSLSKNELGMILNRQGVEKAERVDIDSDDLVNDANSAHWRIIRKYQWVLRYLPFVHMVAVCNAVAMNTADRNSDIDLFVITNKGRIFTARVLMTVLFHIIGIRRHGKRITNRFCLTFFVADDSMRLKVIAKEKDVYLKYWILTLKPIFGEVFFKSFMDSNGIKGIECEHSKGKSWISRAMERLLSGVIGETIERRLKVVHLRRWEKLKGEIGNNHGIVVSDSMLKFHNIDMRDYFKEEFKKRGGRYVDTISFF